MKNSLLSLTIVTLALCMASASCGRPQESGGNSSTSASPGTAQTPAQSQSQGQSQSQSDAARQRQQAEQQARPEIEKRRQEAQQQADQTLDKEAVAAIAETQSAVKAIAANKSDEALAAIERATGKINILLARNPATALIPVSDEVEVIDAAPLDVKAIRARAAAATKAVDDKDYPAARVLLYGLTSEIRARTYNLPLATYPDALKEAARLLDQKKNDEANNLLLTALNTLVVVDHVTPLPLVAAQAEINEAQATHEKDKDGAQKLLDMAKSELERAKELGYAGNDPEYAALDKSISDLESQLKGGGDTASAFSALKEKVGAFFKRLSEGAHG
jgi:hypothetical protein